MSGLPTMDAAEAFKLVKQQVSVPLVADIHFDYRIALKVAEYGVDCLRIHPAISAARSVSVRWWIAPIIIISLSVSGLIGGSLEKISGKIRRPTPEALVESAMRHVDILDRLNFNQF